MHRLGLIPRRASRQPCSCVVRITGIALGYSHDTTIEVCATWSDFAPVRLRLTFSDVSNIEQRLRTLGCMLVLSPSSPRHLPVIESIVLPLLDQGASYAAHSTQPTASPEARREPQVVACNPQAARYRYAFSHSNLNIFRTMMALVAFWTHSPSTR